jgi:RNA polymerase sigma-70 factor (ECF subfamily)
MGDASSSPTPERPEPSDRFEALYRAELAYVLRTLRRLGVKEADAADLAHDVFVVVHRRYGEYDQGRPVRPWLFGIAYRLVGNHLGRAHRQAEISTDLANFTAVDPRAAALDQQGARDLLLRALAAVDVDHRAVLVLHDIEERAAPEVAAILGPDRPSCPRTWPRSSPRSDRSRRRRPPWRRWFWPGCGPACARAPRQSGPGCWWGSCWWPARALSW